MLNCRLVVDVGSDFDSLNFAPFRLPQFIALSTWIRTLAIDCVVSTSSQNWPFSERKGGIFKVTSIGSNRFLI